MQWIKDRTGKSSLNSIVIMAGCVIAVLVGGHFIALTLFNIPTRRDTLIFFALIMVIPVLKFPKIGVYFLFVVPPFISLFRRVYYLLYDRPGQDLLHIISDVVVAILVIVYFDRVRKDLRIRMEDPGLLPLLWVFILYQLFRTFIVTYSGTANGLHHFKFVALYITCFFFAVYFIQTREQIIRIFKITSVIGLFAALYGIKQVFLGYAEFEKVWLDIMRSKFVTLFIEGEARTFSIFQSPACFSDYMLISTIISYCLLIMKKTQYKIFYIICIPVMLFALLLTSVRTNWLGMIIGILFWFIIAHRSAVKVKIGLMILVFFGFMGFSIVGDAVLGGGLVSEPGGRQTEEDRDRGVTNLFVTERVSAVTNPFQEHSMLQRVEMWRIVLSRTSHLPDGPFGFGMGSFDAHSYYFSTLFDTGYIGLFLLLWIIIRILKVGYKVYQEEEEWDKRIIVRGIMTILVVICIINTTGTHTASHPADIYFWFLAGLLIIIRRVKSEEVIKKERDLMGDFIIDAT